MRSVVACLLLAACQATPTAEERLVPLVHDEDRGVRYAAVVALGKAGTGEAALAQALRDPEWCVRAEAAVALSRVGPRALPLVLAAARDPDREVRLESWTALRKMGLDALRKGHADFRKGLASADAEERLEAARCLVLLGPAENDVLLPVVLKALEEERDPDLLCRAAWVLRSIGPPGAAAAPMLEAWLADKKWSHYDAFREALAAIKPEPPAIEPRPSEAGAREQLASDDLEGVLDGAIALEKLGIDPRPLLAARDDENAARVFVILGPGSTPPPERWLYTACAESAAIALGQRRLPADALYGMNARVRAAAVWSHGRAGIAVPEALDDEDPVVREAAVRTLGPRELAAALLNRDVAIRRLAANRCAEEHIFVAELMAAARAEDHGVRILATRALSRCGQPFLPALDDTSRAVRLEAVLGLSARHEEQLLHALGDPDWRIRRAALQRLGRSKRAAEAAAPFVGDLNPLLSEAAADALSRMGADAALPLARILPGANEAVRYHAPRIFEAIGKDGAAAVPTLLPLLKDPDVNVREFAARCLEGVGPGARHASEALVNALADPRLCVVSNAALALGRIGVTPELERALQDPRARVRAYAAFAYGWACGDARKLDQVPFEVRLPVLDCGEAPPGKFPALRSKDPAIAIPCAAEREYDEVDAWEAERVMELLLCGGCRPDAPGDFGGRFRNILGSAELPAQMQYLVRARRTDPSKEGVFGDNHRIARRENIPAFLWFARTEDDDSLNGVSEIYMPVYATHDLELYVRDEGGLRGPGIPPALRAALKNEGGLWIPDYLWWLNEVTPLESDAPALVDFARWSLGPEGDDAARVAAIRALGKVHDAASERLLREVAARTWPRGSSYATGEGLPLLALASLARRGHPDALATLSHLAFDEWDFKALGPLMEAAPGFAMTALRARMLAPADTAAACAALEKTLRELSPQGVRLEETLFAGVAEAAIASDLDSHALARIAVTVPGCRRAALAEAALSRLDPRSWLPEEEEQERPDLEAAAFLHSASPDRFVAALREWSNDPDERVRMLALRMLLRIGDPPSAEKLIGVLGPWDTPDLLARTHAPAIESFLAERAEAGEPEGLLAYYGWRYGFLPETDGTTIVRWLRNGEAVPHEIEALEKAEEHHFEPELGRVKDPRVSAWLRNQRSVRAYDYPSVLRALVLAGDRDARAELWSIVRCGRHLWLYSHFDERTFTLDWDFSTLPHWIEELDSNCCRVAGGLEDIFDKDLGMSWLYDRPNHGLAEPRSQRVRTEFLWSGGTYVWDPLVDHFVATPD